MRERLPKEALMGNSETCGEQAEAVDVVRYFGTSVLVL